MSRTLKEQLDLCLRAVGVDAAEHETEERQGRESEDNKNREDYACLTEAPHDPESYGRVEDGA